MFFFWEREKKMVKLVVGQNTLLSLDVYFGHGVSKDTLGLNSFKWSWLNLTVS